MKRFLIGLKNIFKKGSGTQSVASKSKVEKVFEHAERLKRIDMAYNILMGSPWYKEYMDVFKILDDARDESIKELKTL